MGHPRTREGRGTELTSSTSSVSSNFFLFFSLLCSSAEVFSCSSRSYEMDFLRDTPAKRLFSAAALLSTWASASYLAYVSVWARPREVDAAGAGSGAFVRTGRDGVSVRRAQLGAARRVGRGRRRARGKTNLCGLPRARQRRRGQICLRLGLLATRHGLTPPEPDLHDCPAPARTPGPLEEDQVDHSTPFGFCLVCGFKPSKEELVFVVYGGFCGVYTRNVPRGLEDGEGHVLG